MLARVMPSLDFTSNGAKEPSETRRAAVPNHEQVAKTNKVAGDSCGPQLLGR